MKRSAGTRPALNSIPLAFLASALLCPTGALYAQPETYEDTTDVIEIQVPVNVTSKSGEPVRGLSAEDFQLIDGNSLVQHRDIVLVGIGINPQLFVH